MRPTLRTKRMTHSVSLAALVLLVSAYVAAPFAFALTPMSVTYGTVPAGWKVDLREPPEYPEYSLNIGTRAENEDGTIAYTASVYVSQSQTRYDSMDAFMREWDLPTIEQNLSGIEGFDDSNLSFEDAKEFSGTDSGTTEVGGRTAYYTSATYQTTMESFSGPVEAGRATTYYVDLGDSGVIIMVSVMTRQNNFDKLETLWAQADGLYQSMRFDWGGGGGSTGGAAAGGGLPWQPIAGGLGAVAAAAAAMAGAAARTSAKSKTKQDPNQPIGYILNVSSDRLSVSAEQSQPLTVTVYQVMPNGQAVPAAANVSLTAPLGASVQPAAGASPLSAVVWQTGEIAPGAQLLVQATAAGGSSQAAVAVVGAGELRLDVTFEPPEKRELIASGADRVTLVATVAVPPGVAADPSVDLTLVRSSIEFSSASEWLDLSAPVIRSEGMAVSVEASQPDPDHPKDPPPTCIVHVKAQVGAKTLTESVSIAMARNPVLDAAPDVVEFSAETGATAEVRAWVDHGAGAQWEFATAWRDGSQPLAQVDLERTGPAMCTLTLTEDAAGKLDPARPEDSATLVVTASATGYDTLERYVKVIVRQEGIFIDPIGRNPEDGRFRIAADGSGTPTEIDVRVYVRDPASGAVSPDIALAQTVTFEPAGETGTPGRLMLEKGAVTWESAGVRSLNVPAAIWKFGCPRRLPTGGRVLPATLRAYVDGPDKPYEALVSLGLLGVDTEPFSAEWKKEYEYSERIIADFVPADVQPRFRKILAERGRTLGAEGLFEMRKRIWEFAQTQIMIEVHDYLDEAWRWQNAEDLFDWISWCGDIAFGVATGSLVGSAAAIGLGLVKPMLVSAIDCWVNGRSLEEWAYQQVGIGIGVVEGCATDVDFIKMLGARAPLAWAGFLAYYFAKELYNDPEMDVVRAMTNVARMVRDEALVIFLRRVCKVSPGVHPGSDAPDATPPKKAGTADGPDAPPKTKPKASGGGGDDGPPPPKKPAVAAGADGQPPGRPGDTPIGKPKPGADAGTTGKPTGGADAPPPGKPKPAGGDTPDAASPTKKPGATDGPETPPKEKSPGEQKPTDTSPEKAPGDKPTDKPTSEKSGSTSPDAPKSPGKPISPAEQVRSGIRKGKDGKPYAKKSDVLEIMTDPQAVRSLKNAPPEVQAAFENTRQLIYEGHDIAVENHVRTKVPGMAGKEIKVMEIRSPGSDGTSLNTDRDFRVCYKDVDPKTGKEIWIEVDRRNWEMESNRAFAEATGGPTHPPEAAAQWAKDHQQLPTDRTHPEACADFSDQALTKDPKTGEWVQTQIKSNVEWVREGKSTLVDPDGIGKMYENKVADAFKGDQPTTEAFVQADKAVRDLVQCRTGYMAQDYKLPPLPDNLRNGMQIVQRGASDPTNPAAWSAADAELRQAGFPGGLAEFMKQMRGQFGALDNVTK